MRIRVLHEGADESVQEYDVLYVEVCGFANVVLGSTTYGNILIRDEEYEGEVPS